MYLTTLVKKKKTCASERAAGSETPRLWLIVALSLVLSVAVPSATVAHAFADRASTGSLLLLAGGFIIYQLGVIPIWHVVGWHWRAIAATIAVAAIAAGSVYSVLGRLGDPWTVAFAIALIAVPLALAITTDCVSKIRFDRAPLPPGTYAIIHGGATFIWNNHAGTESQRYAIDLVRLDRGRRADSPLPQELGGYASFRWPLLAIADGVIVKAVADLPDMPIGQRDPRHPAGNHVVLRTAEGDVLYAHMASESLVVGVGDSVAAGCRLGAIGNSGNTTEPHLHIQLKRDGKCVPFRFAGTVPRRNGWFRVR